MIGIIVTGHGSFAAGLTSGLKLLAGETQFYEAVDFMPEDSIELLTAKLKDAMERLSNCNSLLFLADLTGGSPFNVASRLKLENNSILTVVAGGANLPMVLEAYMSRTMFTHPYELAAASIEAAKKQMVCFVAPSNDDNDCECEEYEE